MTRLPESISANSWFGPVRVIPDKELAPFRPRSKVRGRRGYYRTLARDAERFSLEPLSPWYDYMHWHADWSGLGNVRWRERRAHLAALFVMFRRLIAQTTDWSRPHQAWLQIDAVDSSQDAVYLHTLNPNTSNFPNLFTGVVWDAPVPDRLREFVTEPTWQFGRLDDRWTHFMVRVRAAV